MMRPTFCVATAYLDPADRDVAVDLGMELYDHLTRDRNDPLAFGAGIPVYVGMRAAVPDAPSIVELADHLLLVVVAGADPLLRHLDESVEGLNRLAARLGPRNVLLVNRDRRWRTVASRLRGIQLVACQQDELGPAVDEVLLVVSRVLARGRNRPRLAVSHAVTEQATGQHEAAPQVTAILSAARTHPLFHLFFDEASESSEFAPGDSSAQGSRAKSGDESIGSGTTEGRQSVILLSVRSDDSAMRPECESDLMAAKRMSVPIVLVDTCLRGERRSSPYAGNVPTVVWHDNPDEILRVAVVEYLRTLHFGQVAARVLDSTGLPVNTLPLSRPPELLDTAGGVLSRTATRTVLYPDPELPVFERDLLREAAPWLRMFTPSTAFRRSLGEEADSSGDPSVDGQTELSESPLSGLRIALSVSDATDRTNGSGLKRQHREDIAVQLVRGLVSSGASIAYGGDLRFEHATSFTSLLSETITAYNQTADRAADLLHVYLAAYTDLSAAPSTLLCRVHHLSESDDVRQLAALPVPAERPGIPRPMYDMDMRRVMNDQVDARIAIGGNALPRGENVDGPTTNHRGYGGRFPGVIEEVYRAMRAGQPVYVCGGTGGAAGLLAELFQNPSRVPESLAEASHQTNRRFISVRWDVDQHPLREQLTAPEDLDAMANAIGTFAEDVLCSDASSRAWNGLTIEQNETLWRSRDPLVIGALILEGLIRWRQDRIRTSGKRRIEVLLGDLTSVERVDLIAVPVFDDVEPQGAAATIDEVTGGLVRQMRGKERSLLGLQTPGLDASFLSVVSLGAISQLPSNADVAKAIRNAAARVAEECLRHGFRSLALVTFGGATLDYAQAVSATLDGLRSLGSSVLVKWVERKEEKFQTLVRQLKEDHQIAVTTLARRLPVAATTSERWLQLNVLRHGDRMVVRVLSPSNTSVALMSEVPLDQDELESLSAGSGSNGNRTPSATDLLARGRRLAQLLFGNHSEQIAAAVRDCRFEVTHDAASSRLPFELLCLGEEDYRPALALGLHRRLEIRATSATASLIHHPVTHNTVRIGLVVNPTEDLPGSVREADCLSQLLQTQRGNVEMRRLEGSRVDREHFQELLLWADVLHYCGHAFFEGSGQDESGLLLAGSAKFTADDLARTGHLPRIMFFNACQAGRIRKSVAKDDATFALAELVLQTGVEAFMGTYWEVRDDAAAEFAATVYQRLAQGRALSEAVTAGRRTLQQNGRSDWANYLLYGDGRFRFA